MNTPNYPFNPYQDVVAARVTQVIAVSENKMEYVPRVAPFFSRDCVITKVGDSAPLTFGKDYVFAHPFDEFITLYKRNVFGSIILLTPYSGNIAVECDTIGGPFILDDVAFAKFIVDILTKPREMSWDNLAPENIPATFPTPPHDHPIIQTYDYLEMMTQLRSLVISTNSMTGGVSIADQLQAHIEAALPQAHSVKIEDLGLEQIPNIPRATSEDLNGNSDDSIVTVAILKEALRMLTAGTLDLN